MSFETGASIVLGDASNLSSIYKDMEQQFPPCELLKYDKILELMERGRYKLLKYRRLSDYKTVGYALIYKVEDSNLLWGDYLAIRKEFQCLKYGSCFIQAIIDKYCGPYEGLLFSVEHVSNSDPALAKNQKRRIKFYKNLGAHRLHAHYLQPTDDGCLPMYLYFKPREDVTGISREAQIHAISKMYEYCFSHLKHCSELLPRFESTIRDETFED